MLRLVSFLLSFFVLFWFFFFLQFHLKFAAKLFHYTHSPPLDLTEATLLKKKLSDKWVAAQCGSTSDSDKDVSSTETFLGNHGPISFPSSLKR